MRDGEHASLWGVPSNASLQGTNAPHFNRLGKRTKNQLFQRNESSIEQTDKNKISCLEEMGQRLVVT